MKDAKSIKIYEQNFAAFTYPIMVRKKKVGSFLSVLSYHSWNVIKRIFWVFALVFIPAEAMIRFRPGLEDSKSLLTVFIWFWMLTIRESLVNTDIFNIKKEDKVLFRSFNISYGNNFLGKFKLKIWTEVIVHVALLIIFGLDIYHTVCLALMTFLFRIIGEKSKLNHFNNNNFHICWNKLWRDEIKINIVCVVIAYGFPLSLGMMGNGWFWLIHPVCIACVALKAFLNWKSMSNYKNYAFLKAERMSIE